MFVKICGTTSFADAELAIASGADAVGFVFAQSKRQVNAAQVAQITAEMPSGVERVGVFSSVDAGEITKAVQEAHLTAVQLHGRQDPDLIGALVDALGTDVKLWQVVSFEVGAEDAAVADQSFQQRFLSAMDDARIAAVLLDTARGGRSGGTGESFPWERAAQLMREARMIVKERSGRAQLEPTPVIVAGGLSAGNVAEAIDVFSPWGVDCVSGVEAEPGRKDPNQLQSFVKAARGEG